MLLYQERDYELQKKRYVNRYVICESLFITERKKIIIIIIIKIL